MSSAEIRVENIEVVDRTQLRRAVTGACLGAAFEWYDFFLYSALAVFFGGLFFPKGSEAAGLLASLATFGAGFVVRPLGAVIFGRLGDKIGRKYTFLLTIILMGVTTAGIGFLPTFQQVGWLAPALLVTLRLVQGLSLGGEYGGAATYVAEFAPDKERGYYTAWVQTTATLGQVAGLLAVLIGRATLSPDDFAAWGWRLPFFFSLILLAISVYIRMRLEESPVFKDMQQRKQQSRSPLAEAFGQQRYLKPLLLGFLVSAATGTITYTTQVYIVSYLIAVMKVDPITVNVLVIVTLLAGVPMLLYFGKLSDRIGRKWILMFGCLLSALTFFPIYKAITHYANPALESFQERVKVTVAADDCHFRLFVMPNTKLTECDQVRDLLTRYAVSYTILPGSGSHVVTTIGENRIEGFDAAQLTAAFQSFGYPAKADPERINRAMLLLLLLILTAYASMLFAPLSAFLVEQFPTRTRYTSVSVAYNFGAGWFGGMTPFLISAIAASTGNIYDGFWYPVVVSAVVCVAGSLFMKNAKNIRLKEV